MSLSDLYDEAAPTYDAGYRKTINYVEEWLIHEQIEMLYPLGRVLSLGCGTGHDITMCQLEPEGFFGIDISAGMIRQAQQKYPNYKFMQRDVKKPIGSRWDTVLGIFGVVNYAGLDVVVERFKETGAKKMFLVMFAPQYTPEISNAGFRHYSEHQVRELLCGFKVNMTGLSFPLPDDEAMSLNQLYEAQRALMHGLDGCNYWVVSVT